ncbi:hypothetical protein F443_05885 [Phytophthora nicotianae P1569]|uniref:Uncharacterized protein n=1 Tax=Phytophthora nicotianae P1569 TaxID=1317065 RepID=V9FII5_PHYNI|nr:hypothetical protein F443_05885 [Phytophthora nicotianae P1569]
MVPPLCRVDGRDMPNRKQQKRLSELRYLMTKIENNATSKNLLRGGQSIEETIKVFLDCAESVSVDATTKHSHDTKENLSEDDGKKLFAAMATMFVQAVNGINKIVAERSPDNK